MRLEDFYPTTLNGLLHRRLLSIIAFAILSVLIPASALTAVIFLTSDSQIKDSIYRQSRAGMTPLDSSKPIIFGNSVDNYSDCLAQSIIVFGNENRNAAQKMADVDIVYSAKIGPCQILAALKSSKDIPEATIPYVRYWHSHIAFSRPLLLVGDLNDLRVVATIIRTMSFVIFLYLVCLKRLTIITSFGFAVFLGLTTDIFYIGMSYTHSLAISALFLASTFLFLRTTTRGYINYMDAAICSAVVCLFDILLVAPLVPIFFACILVCALAVPTDLRKVIRLVIAATIIPVVVFAYLTIAKVGLYAIFGTMFDYSITAVIKYLFTTWSVASPDAWVNPIDAIGTTAVRFTESPFATLALLILAILFLVDFSRGKLVISETWPAIFLIFFISLSWFIAMPGHASMHAIIVTFRYFPFTIIAMLLVCFRRSPELSNVYPPKFDHAGSENLLHR